MQSVVGRNEIVASIGQFLSTAGFLPMMNASLRSSIEDIVQAGAVWNVGGERLLLANSQLNFSGVTDLDFGTGTGFAANKIGYVLGQIIKNGWGAVQSAPDGPAGVLQALVTSGGKIGNPAVLGAIVHAILQTIVDIEQDPKIEHQNWRESILEIAYPDPDNPFSYLLSALQACIRILDAQADKGEALLTKGPHGQFGLDDIIRQSIAAVPVSESLGVRAFNTVWGEVIVASPAGFGVAAERFEVQQAAFNKSAVSVVAQLIHDFTQT